GRCTRVDGKTALGKIFVAIAERLGLEQAVLTRAEDLEVPFRVLDEEGAHIVARSDLFTMLAPAETNALLALMLEQARPGARLLSSLPAAAAAKVVTALLAAVGHDVGADPGVMAHKERIVAAAGAERLDRWAAELSGVGGV